MHVAEHQERVELLTIKEACRRLGCARSHFYAVVVASGVPIRKLGAASRIRSDELATYILNLPAAPVRERR